MSLIPRFCGQCGNPLDKKVIESQERLVCTKCKLVCYQNPLPVAVALVLNDKREVLLVKRKNNPGKGMWCLPMGFAEINETIAQATLRVLNEETSIKGRIIRLLDTTSAFIDSYGDLLLVTFEVDKIGGVEKIGDDADEIGYFSLQHLPTMAFESNEYAIRYCLSAHDDGWKIEDSFRGLEIEEREKLSDAFVDLIQKSHNEISRTWLYDVKNNESTKTYWQFDSDILLDKVSTSLLQLEKWLKISIFSNEIAEFYRSSGAERSDMGFKMDEVIISLGLLRQHIINFIKKHEKSSGALGSYRMLELENRIMFFFDKIIIYTIQGYVEGKVDIAIFES